MPLDTGELWVRWLLRKAGRNPSEAVAQIERFTREYRAHTLDIDEFVDFQLSFLASFKRAFLEQALLEYRKTILEPNVPEASRRLVDKHRAAGHRTVLCTATYDFVTRAAADIFGIDDLLATHPEEDEFGEFTGRIVGIPTYQEGKVKWLKDYICRENADNGCQFDRIWFYSDSCADLPMFEWTAAAGGTCCVVNASDELTRIARERGWLELSTFNAADLERTALLQKALVTKE